MIERQKNKREKHHVKAVMNNKRKTAATIMEIIETKMGKNGSVILAAYFVDSQVCYSISMACTN